MKRVAHFKLLAGNHRPRNSSMRKGRDDTGWITNNPEGIWRPIISHLLMMLIMTFRGRCGMKMGECVKSPIPLLQLIVLSSNDTRGFTTDKTRSGPNRPVVAM